MRQKNYLVKQFEITGFKKDSMKEETPQEIAERELADKIKPLLAEIADFENKRGCGVTLEKNQYIGMAIKETEKEIEQLKTPKSESNSKKD